MIPCEFFRLLCCYHTLLPSSFCADIPPITPSYSFYCGEFLLSFWSLKWF